MTASAGAARGHAPLSVAQEALWYESLLNPRQITYNEAISIRRDGPLDVAALRRAFNALVRRHEAWHTTFELVEGEPTQVLHRPTWHELPVIDLSTLSPEAAERRAVQIVAEVASVPYDVARGPLLRPRLVRLGVDHHRLYLALHHLIFDGTSMTRVVLPELAALYASFAADQAPGLLEPAAQYADYARWEHEWIMQPRAARRLAYWREHLEPACELVLPTDRPRPEAPSGHGAQLAVSLPRATVTVLREVARRCDATFFQALAAGWALLLARYAGQDDVVFATVANLRQRPELEAVVGYGVSPLVLRVDLGGVRTFPELITCVRNELLDGLDHLVPFERVVRELGPGGDRPPAGNPVYQTMIVLEPAAASADPGWSMHQMESEIGAAVGNLKVDLELQLDERPDGCLVGRLIYDRDLFDPDTAERIGAHWSRLLEGVAADAEQPIDELSMLSAGERDRQLNEWNATATERPAATVLELFERGVAHDPGAPAVTVGRRTVSYAQLDARAAGVAARLRAAGIGPADVVAVCAAPSIELISGLLGVLRTGAAYVVCTDDSVGEADAALVSPDRHPRLRDGVALVALVGPDGNGRSDGGGSAPDAPCAVTATPDGRRLTITHGAVVNHTRAIVDAVSLGPADCVLALPESLTSPSTLEPWPALSCGARLVLASPAAAGDGTRLSRQLRSETVTFMHATPDQWERLLDTGLRSARALRALSGGDPLPRELADQLLKRYRVVWNAYGSPRLGGYRLLGRVDPTGPVTVGRPVADTRAYVLDHLGQPVPVGVSGELCVAGLGIGPVDSGGEPSRFVAEPSGAGVAERTGDRARWLADGRIELAK